MDNMVVTFSLIRLIDSYSSGDVGKNNHDWQCRQNVQRHWLEAGLDHWTRTSR